MRNRTMPRFGALLLATAAVLAQAPAQRSAPTDVAALRQLSPKQFLGHDVGEDYRLCNYTDMIRYFRKLEEVSDRMRLVDIGRSSYGQTMHMAVISSPQNLARIERLREISRTLCRARDGDERRARELAAEGCAVVWVDAGLHATETIAGQNIIELVWQMLSRDDAEVRRILDQVVLLACPVNPDGYELIANAYRATQNTSIPVLYQRFIGHDNNRDFYACNQLEATNVNRVFYTDWCPQIVYNHHQTAPRGTIIFTPPFRDPFNYHADPNVVRGIELVSAHMNSRFAREGKPGVISRSGAPYSGWWNGGLRTTCYFHNIIGILTEAFGRPEPTRIVQTMNRRLPNGDYPDPVPTQMWHARQTVEYLQTANFAILDYAARYREELLHGIWRMGRNAIEKGSRDHWTSTPALLAAAENREEPESVFEDPLLRDARAYVLRRDQRNWPAAVRLVRALQKNGIDVLQAGAAFDLDGARIPAGSIVIETAQAFRAHVVDMFEPQHHPNDIRDGKPVPPYDAAGWTLSMQMGVDVIRCLEPVAGPLTPLTQLLEAGTADVAAADTGWKLDPRNAHTVIAINRLLGNGTTVQRDGQDFYVPGGDGVREALADAVRGLGVAPEPVTIRDRRARPRLRQPRVGLFDVYGGHMPTGWCQWVLQEFGFPVQQVWGDRIHAGDLRRDYDVLLFLTGLPGGRDLSRLGRGRDDESMQKLAAALPPFEDWTDLESRATRLDGDTAWPALRAFVEQGGTLLAFGGECDKVIRQWDLPVRVGTHVKDPEAEGGERRTRRDEFYIPGSLVALDVDVAHPLAAGMRREPAAMFTSSCPVFEVTGEGVETVAAYRTNDTLVSGWAVGQQFLAGKAAVVSARSGSGRLVLYGADVTYRGQPLGTFPLVFSAILGAAVE